MKHPSVSISFAVIALAASVPARAENATNIAIQQAQQTTQATQDQMAMTAYNINQDTSARAAQATVDSLNCANSGTCQYQQTLQAPGGTLDLNRILFGHTWDELASPTAAPVVHAAHKKFGRRHVVRYSRYSEQSLR